MQYVSQRMRPAHNRGFGSGFTLIELLVVISIIGLLASVVLASLNSARAKARDATRLATVRQIGNVLQLYYDANGAFPSTAGCNNGWCCLGHGTAGRCWAGGIWGSDALDASLVPYLSKIPDDPLNNTSGYGDAYTYRVDTDVNGPYATLHWGIEKSAPTAADCAGGTSGFWGAPPGIGAGYYCMLAVR